MDSSVQIPQQLTLELSRLVNQHAPDDITLKETRNLSVKLSQIIVDQPRKWKIEKVV